MPFIATNHFFHIGKAISCILHSPSFHEPIKGSPTALQHWHWPTDQWKPLLFGKKYPSINSDEPQPTFHVCIVPHWFPSQESFRKPAKVWNAIPANLKHTVHFGTFVSEKWTTPHPHPTPPTPTGLSKYDNPHRCISLAQTVKRDNFSRTAKRRATVQADKKVAPFWKGKRKNSNTGASIRIDFLRESA